MEDIERFREALQQAEKTHRHQVISPTKKRLDQLHDDSTNDVFKVVITKPKKEEPEHFKLPLPLPTLFTMMICTSLGWWLLFRRRTRRIRCHPKASGVTATKPKRALIPNETVPNESPARKKKRSEEWICGASRHDEVSSRNGQDDTSSSEILPLGDSCPVTSSHANSSTTAMLHHHELSSMTQPTPNIDTPYTSSRRDENDDDRIIGNTDKHHGITVALPMETNNHYQLVPAMIAEGTSMGEITSLPRIGIAPSSSARNDDDQQREQEQKVAAASKLVEGLKFYEQVLQEQGVSQSIATQAALTLQMADSQRTMEATRLQHDAFQKHMDRQQLQHHHQETLQAQSYDPNWKEKLLQKRASCRNLIFALLWSMVAANVILPRLQPFVSLLLGRTNEENGTGHWPTTAFDTLQLAVSYLCDCSPTTNSMDVLPHSSDSGWWLLTKAKDILYQSTISYYIIGEGGGQTISEFALCYGYCLISVTCYILPTLVLHQALSAMAAPLVLHHCVNTMGLLLWYQPTAWSLAFLSHTPKSYIVQGMALLFLALRIELVHRRHVTNLSQTPVQGFAAIWSQTNQDMDKQQMQLNLSRWMLLGIGCAAALFRIPNKETM